MCPFCIVYCPVNLNTLFKSLICLWNFCNFTKILFRVYCLYVSVLIGLERFPVTYFEWMIYMIFCEFGVIHNDAIIPVPILIILFLLFYLFFKSANNLLI